MPIIIHKPKGEPLDKEEIEREISFYEIGCLNFSYVEGGEVKVYKKKITKNTWKKLDSLKNNDVILYCDYEDSFENSGYFNTPPFYVNKGISVVFTGSIPNARITKGNDMENFKSFSGKILRNFVKNNPDFLFTKEGGWFINRILKKDSAMICLNSNGDVKIFNKEDGNKLGKLWYFDSELANYFTDNLSNKYIKELNQCVL